MVIYIMVDLRELPRDLGDIVEEYDLTFPEVKVFTFNHIPTFDEFSNTVDDYICGLYPELDIWHLDQYDVMSYVRTFDTVTMEIPDDRLSRLLDEYSFNQDNEYVEDTLNYLVYECEY